MCPEGKNLRCLKIENTLKGLGLNLWMKIKQTLHGLYGLTNHSLGCNLPRDLCKLYKLSLLNAPLESNVFTSIFFE